MNNERAYLIPGDPEEVGKTVEAEVDEKARQLHHLADI